MANLLTRFLASFAGAAPVNTFTPLDGEFNQIYGAGGVLNGGTTGFKLLIKSSDATDPPVESDQIGAGPLAEWKQNGTLKVSIGNTGLFTMANTAVNPGLNADQVDGIEGANIAKLDTALIPWSVSWLVPDPSTASLATEEYTSVLVPPLSTAFTIIGLNVEFRGGSHGAGTSVTFKVVQRGSIDQDLGTIQVSDTNNTPFTLYGADINPDVVLAAGDRLVFTVSARSGTILERNVTVFASGNRKLS